VDLALAWRLYSLSYINHGEGAPASPMQPVRRILFLAERESPDLVARLYPLLAEARFEGRARLDRRGVVRELLADQGIAQEWVDQAWENEALDKEIDRQAMGFALQGGIGVPSLILGEADLFYGPLIDPVPQGQEALRLWDHVQGLIKAPYFYELKRQR
jgi:hypothetical protein